MAIYHCNVKIIGRSQGRSAVASAAYRSAEKIENERDGITHDYTHKTGVVHKEILTPEHAPEWMTDRTQLWNMVEKSETRIDSQTAREVEVSLPNELDYENQVDLLREYVKENFVDKGMIADVCLHDKGDGNPHAHILLTTREIDKNGFKNKNRAWNKKELLEGWRENWAEKTNLYLKRAGHEVKIDHRSYEAQGLDKIPTVHLGVDASSMEKKGIKTEKGDINRKIIEQNKELETIKAQIIDLQKYRDHKQLETPKTKLEELRRMFKESSDYESIKGFSQACSEYLKELGEQLIPLEKKAEQAAKRNISAEKAHEKATLIYLRPNSQKYKLLCQESEEIKILDEKLSTIEKEFSKQPKPKFWQFDYKARHEEEIRILANRRKQIDDMKKLNDDKMKVFKNELQKPFVKEKISNIQKNIMQKNQNRVDKFRPEYNQVKEVQAQLISLKAKSNLQLQKLAKAMRMVRPGLRR